MMSWLVSWQGTPLHGTTGELCWSCFAVRLSDRVWPRFRIETADDSLQPTIDMLLNISVFLWFGAVCPWASFRSNDVIPIWRLIFLGILILLFRRLPVIFAMHKHIREIEEVHQAAFVGFFGPIGVSAIFYLYVSLDFLNQITVNGEVREDARRLGDVMRVVVWFLAICSIVVHGLSVPLGKLGYHLPRTMSQALSTERDEDEPDLSIHHHHQAGINLRRRKNLGNLGHSDHAPSTGPFAIGRRNGQRGEGVETPPEPHRPVHFIDTPPPGTQTPVARETSGEGSGVAEQQHAERGYSM